MTQNGALRRGHYAILVIECHGIMGIHAGLIRSHRRFHARNRRIVHDHVDEVDRIYANIQQCAAGQGRIGDARLRRGGVAQIGIDGRHLADDPGRDDIVDHRT